MSIIDDTSWKQHLAELNAYARFICKDCDFNYVVHDEIGAIQYCSVLDIYEPTMRIKSKCEHQRIDNKYTNDMKGGNKDD